MTNQYPIINLLFFNQIIFKKTGSWKKHVKATAKKFGGVLPSGPKAEAAQEGAWKKERTRGKDFC